MRKGERPPKVMGLCAAGHVTEREAPRRRVTWQGPCGTEGCGLPVVCRRVPSAAPERPDEKTLPSGAKVRRVHWDERRPRGERPATKPADSARAELPPDDEPPAARGSLSAGGDEPAAKPAFAPGRRSELVADEIIPGVL